MRPKNRLRRKEHLFLAGTLLLVCPPLALVYLIGELWTLKTSARQKAF